VLPEREGQLRRRVLARGYWNRSDLSGEEVAMVVALDAGLPNNRCSARGPRALVEFFRNLFWWVIDDFMQTSRAEMAARFRSKATLIEINIVPGSHENTLREPYVHVLADALRRSFDEVDKRVGDHSRVV
jgi:hypothetical protein